jgi:hypothetical protein
LEWNLFKNNCYRSKINNLKLITKNKLGTKIIEKPKADVCYLPSIDLICIDKNLSSKKKFYLITHEIGHAINTKQGKEYKLDINSKTKQYAVQQITNEIFAWNAGINFLNENGIQYSKEYLEKLKSNCINTYILSSVEQVYSYSLKMLNSKRKI